MPLATHTHGTSARLVLRPQNTDLPRTSLPSMRRTAIEPPSREAVDQQLQKMAREHSTESASTSVSAYRIKGTLRVAKKTTKLHTRTAARHCAGARRTRRRAAKMFFSSYAHSYTPTFDCTGKGTLRVVKKTTKYAHAHSSKLCDETFDAPRASASCRLQPETAVAKPRSRSCKRRRDHGHRSDDGAHHDSFRTCYLTHHSYAAVQLPLTPE